MGNIMHKDQNSLKIKELYWQDIGRNKKGKNMMSIMKEMHQSKGTLLQD